MSKVYPFPALRYASDRIPDLSRVISPPYDKVSPEERETLWQRDEHNAVRVILPLPGGRAIDVVTESTDGEGKDWYAEAAARFQEWIRQGVLQEDPTALYLYRQSFTYAGQRYTRSGLFGALKLEEEGSALAHEFTFEGPKQDRLRLTRAAKANLSPIFLLADGTAAEWENLFRTPRPPAIHFTDLEGQEHSVIALRAADELASVQSFLDQRTFVIADGHHRFETALNYRRERIQQTGRDPAGEPWGFVLALIVPIHDPGLLVLPTHRVLSALPGDWLDRLGAKAKEHFHIEPVTDLTPGAIASLFAPAKYAHSLLAVSKNRAVLLTRREEIAVPALNSVPAAIRSLNVSLLHHLVLPEYLELTPDALQGKIRYIRGEEAAFSLVRGGEYDGAFLLAGIQPQCVFEVSRQGVRMPQKSTDFYPKIPTGLVFRSLSGHDD